VAALAALAVVVAPVAGAPEVRRSTPRENKQRSGGA